MPYLLIALGGGIGACARHALGQLLDTGTFPLGTMSANVLGGLLMGVLFGWLASQSDGESARLFFGTGLLGGFTTFSAFSLQSVQMLGRGEMGTAMLYIAGSVVLSIGALALGLLASRAVFA